MFDPGVIADPSELGFSFPLSNGSSKAKIGKLYIEDRFGPLESDRSGPYPMGFHYFVEKPEWGQLTDIEIRPVLMSGVHVFGTQEIFMPTAVLANGPIAPKLSQQPPGLRSVTHPRTGVASMVYFLTDEEERFLQTDHRPVHFQGENVVLEPNAV